jgi:hypothetical protein
LVYFFKVVSLKLFFSHLTTFLSETCEKYFFLN